MLRILIYLSITEYYWVWILSYVTVLLQTAVKFQNDLAVLSFRFLRWSFIWYFVVFSTRLFSCDTSLLFSCSGTLCSSEFQPFWLRHQNPITVVLNCENLYGNHGRSVDPEGFFFSSTQSNSEIIPLLCAAYKIITNMVVKLFCAESVKCTADKYSPPKQEEQFLFKISIL